MFGPVRPMHWIMLAAVVPIAGCGDAGVYEERNGESVDSTQLAAEGDPLSAALYSKRSSAKKFRGTAADFITCTGSPVNMGITMTNRGTETWRDVEGRGNKVGSDVKFVTTSGERDTMVGKKFLSVHDNVNDNVRGAGSGADYCANQPGCRRTYFNAEHLWVTAPKVPGYYGGRWRLRDFSDAHPSSEPFGPKVRMRFYVKQCERLCGCVVSCTDGSDREVPADQSNCTDVGDSFCYPASYLAHRWEDCGQPSVGGTGGTGGSGSGGSGGTGNTGNTGGSGAWGTGGGSSGGTGGASTGGSAGAGGKYCGGMLCEVPAPLADEGVPCCVNDECGVITPTSTGQCVPVGVPSDPANDPDAYFNNDKEDPNNTDETPDEAGYIDPPEADWDDGIEPPGTHAEEAGGCSVVTRSPSGATALVALALLGLVVRRRRR